MYVYIVGGYILKSIKKSWNLKQYYQHY
jgi:hypothetical protein